MQNIIIHLISYFHQNFIIRTYWNRTLEVYRYSICHIYWWTIFSIDNLSHTITELCTILFKYLLFSQIHVQYSSDNHFFSHSHWYLSFLHFLFELYVTLVNFHFQPLKICFINILASYVFVMILNTLTLIGMRGRNGSPWYILLYDFWVTHPNFMKFGDLGVIFLYFSCWKNEYILDNMYILDNE